MWLSAIVVGLVIGLALGALGGGGSILTVPALIYLVGQDPRQATTGSLVIVGISSAIAMASHARSGHVRWREGLAFGVLGIAGSYEGSRLSAHVPSAVLLTAFALLLALVAVFMVRRTRVDEGPEPVSESLQGSDRTWSPRRLLQVILAASAVGLLTGFFGVGGGFAIVPALVLVMGFPMPAAIGTSLLVIALNSVAAFGARLHVGVDLDWPVIAGFTALAIVGSLVGARLAARIDPRPLTRSFAALLVLVAAYLLIVNVPALFA